MAIKHNILTRSGSHFGWQGKLRENYDSFEQFKAYSDMYGIAQRLGYKTPETAWKYNPICQGSTNPLDFCKINAKGKRVFCKE